MDRLDPAILIASDPEVVGCNLGEGSALLNLRTNIYYSLNAVGAYVWDAVAEPVSFANLVERVCKQYGAPSEVVAGDLAKLVRQLDAAGLVQCTLR